MPLVLSTDDFGFEDFHNRGRAPKNIPDGVFPTIQEWIGMNTIEKVGTSVNLLKAIRAGALWEISMPLLAPCLTEVQAAEYIDPIDGIPNITSGVNGLVNTWMRRNLGISRTDRTHHTVIVRRFTTADDELTVRSFICKHVAYGSSQIHAHGQKYGVHN